MLNMELENSKLSIDETKRPSNFLLGYIHSESDMGDDNLLNIGFMPSGSSEILADLLRTEFERLVKKANDLLLDRDCASSGKDWRNFNSRASDLSEQIEKLHYLLLAFDWHDGQYSNVDFADITNHSYDENHSGYDESVMEINNRLNELEPDFD